MLDLIRVKRELESPVYGAVSHVASVLSRVLQARRAVVACRGVDGGRGTVYVSANGEVSPDLYTRLYQWPEQCESRFWSQALLTVQHHARVMDPGDPSDASPCEEVARVLEMPRVCHDRRCLTMSLVGVPGFRALFVRSADQPPFSEQDTDRVLSYADQCAMIVQDGYHRGNGNGHDQSVQSPGSYGVPTMAQITSRLSKTESKVLRQLHDRLTERQIAEALGRSPNTVHVHVKSIYRKLRISSRKQLLALLDSCPQEDADTDTVDMPHIMTA